jgi:hypothetical protein
VISPEEERWIQANAADRREQHALWLKLVERMNILLVWRRED